MENQDSMYAIVNIAGKQLKVEKNKFVYTPLLPVKEGESIDFEEVMLVSDNGKTKVGLPHVKGAKVQGKLIANVKDDKVIVFKKKRRKGYKVKNGHRQQYSKVMIEDIKG